MSFITFVIGTAVGTLFSDQIKAGTLASVKFCKDKFTEWKDKNAAKVAEQVAEVDETFGDTKVPPKPTRKGKKGKVETYNATETVESESAESENPDA